MTDRELLELAAKAAGIEYSYHHGCGDALELVKPRGFQVYWNPLTDDGDALRLAVKLEIDIAVMKNKSLYSNEELCAATRRAIVRAAAEIGKAMT